MTAKLWGLGAAFSVAAQIVLLVDTGPGTLLLSSTLAWVTWQIWRYRSVLGTHVDMIVLMCGYGGLGMMASTPQCHDTAQGWLKATAGMLALGLAPTFFGSTCLATARRVGDAGGTLLFETLGMMVGMGAMHLQMSFVSTSPVLRHFAMVVGMAGGMIAGTVISGAYFRRTRQKDSNIKYARTKSLSI